MSNQAIKQLILKRKQTRSEAIKLSKKLKRVKTLCCDLEAEYSGVIREYNTLDREYAFELYTKKKAYKKAQAKAKPYDSAKRTAAKALKALESLPEEMRKKIISQAQNELF